MSYKRSFSRKQRYQLLAISGGVCEFCGVKLTKDNFHADHIKPYSMGGETSLANGQALCMNCNLKKGDRYMGDKLQFWNWQQRAHDAVIPIWRDNDICRVKPNVMVEVCTGGGKTFFSVGCFLTLRSQLGAEYMIVVVPNLTVKYTWIKTLNEYGIETHNDVTNDMLRAQKRCNPDNILEGKCCVLTFHQLAIEPELIANVFQKHKILLVVDEIHHADDAKEFGLAVMTIAPLAAFKLALSATPFNSSGGALAMCDFVEDTDIDGDRCRTVVPVFRYTYGEAVRDGVCRRMEFITVTGTVEDTLIDDRTGKKVVKSIDLDAPNSCETFKSLLRADGPFFKEMAINALNAFTNAKLADPHAGLLVVGYSIPHSREIIIAMEKLCKDNPKWSSYKFKAIFHDSPDSSRQIEDLKTDDTDIVVTVKMITEGADVKRLKVLLYATDYKTSNFFAQVAGRIVRMESHLPKSQFAVMVIPAHRTLVHYAYTIEQMCKQVKVKGMPEDPPGGGGGGGERGGLTLVDSTMTVGRAELICQGVQETERHLSELFFNWKPSQRGRMTESDAADMWRTYEAVRNAATSSDGCNSLTTEEAPSSNIILTKVTDYEVDLRERERVSDLNDDKVNSLAIYFMEHNPGSDIVYYARINSDANKGVNIRNKDTMTPIHKLKERFVWLTNFEVELKAGRLSVHRYEKYNKSKRTE